MPVRRLDDAGFAGVAAAIDQVTSQTTIPVGIYWKPGVWDLARSAYIADLDTDPDSLSSFGGWLAQALVLHARRSPQQRAELAAAGEKHPALVSVTRKSFSKKHDLPTRPSRRSKTRSWPTVRSSAGCSPARRSPRKL